MSVSEVQENVENLQKMQEDLMLVKQQLGETSSQADVKEREAFNLSRELSVLEKQLEKLEDPDDDLQLPGRVEALQQRYDTATREAKQAATRKKNAIEQINALEAAIAEAYQATVTVQDILVHQQQIEEAKDEVKTIQSNIKKQDVIINRKDSSTEPLTGLLRQKEDILAEMATGDDSSKELEKIELQIAEHKQQNEQHQKTMKIERSRAEATKAGLVRMLKTAQSKVDMLEAKNDDIVKGLLFFEAEAVGTEFIKTVGVLSQLFIRLRGFHNLLMQHTDRQGGLLHRSPEMLIPSYRLPSFKQVPTLRNGRLFDSEIFERGDEGKKAHLAELERFSEAGIKII